MPLLTRAEVALGKLEFTLMTRGAARLLGFQEGWREIDGVRVPFFARGWGLPILFVHGFGADKETWLALLAAMPRDRSAILVDLPGYGAAGAVDPERASARAQASVLAKLMASLGYARAHLVGNSMGGGIALRFANDYPALAASLTLVGSVGPMPEKSELVHALDRGENPLVVESVSDFDRMTKLVFEKAPPSTRAIRAYLTRDRIARAEGLTRLFRGWSDPPEGDGVADVSLAAIRTPTLVIHGLQDRVIHYATGRALAAEIAGAELVELSGIGHVPQVEAPRVVSRLIEGFLARLGG
jgi:pimeloyl-ACP methyl ester carboxylesterase